jgi:ribosome maturation protein SDO1
MTDKNTVARIKLNGKNFEIMIDDIDKALAFKKTGEGSVEDFLAIDQIFSDHKKGEKAADSDLQASFGSTDVNEIAAQIVKKGEVQVPIEYKHKELSERGKQIIDFYVKNAVDPQSDRPYTADRIERAMSEAGVNVTNKPIESQIKEITEKLSPVIPIKIETKKLLITIPAQYTGVAYSIVNTYKESEEWLGNGDLKVRVNVPTGLQMEFYDKLNSVTHGSAVSEEIQDKEKENE